MATTFSKLTLSGSTDGRPIKVGATSSPGTLIHTASSTATTYDEIWIYAMNTSSTAVALDIQWGGTTSPDDDIELTVQPESGLVTVVPGFPIKGNATPLIVRAFAATTNVITIHGFVNRITA
jgi:hypothetical protein